MSPVASTSNCMSHCTCSIVSFFKTKTKKKEKKMTRLLQHQSHHRESDGAIEWILVLLECCRDYLDAPKWTTEKWIDYLQGGCNKNRFQYCLNSDGFILYMRAIQGHSGGNRVYPSLQNSGNSIHWVQYVCQRWFFSRLPFCYPIRSHCRRKRYERGKTHCIGLYERTSRGTLWRDKSRRGTLQNQGTQYI